LGEVNLDFTGSSPQFESGINVVENYARAYAMFTIKSCLAPDVPNNSGTLRPIKYFAPEGCVVNCKYPAPVAARHVVGMCIPMTILNALHKVVPDRVLAGSSGCPAGMIAVGVDESGNRFFTPFAAAGGMGARRNKDGPSATNYPTGTSATSIEMLEVEGPLLFLRRELRRGSGGRGRFRGGDGQIVEFKVRSGIPWTLTPMSSVSPESPKGLAGGAAGASGRFLINGEDAKLDQQRRMDPEDIVRLETTGGGGYGEADVE
jgi:N-methylhydantoinase B